MTFNALFSPVWVAVAALLLIVVLSWLEIIRKQKLLALRLLAVLLAVISLACLVLNPARNVEKSSVIILLTPNYSNETLDSLIKSESGNQLYKLESVDTKNNIPVIQERDLKGLHGNIHILGDGLPDYLLDDLDTANIQFHPTPAPDGITRLNTKIYKANEMNTIDGVYKSQDNRTLKLLIGDIAIDSTKTKPGTKFFTLNFKPEVSGRFLYDLVEADSSGKILTSTQLPIEVKPQRALNVLLLSDYPSAEIRFLKNYLERQHHRLALRYRVSRDKFRAEFVNTNETNLSRLTETTLQNFDLVVTDISSIGSLSQSEKQTLQRSIQLGLGMVTLLDATSPAKSALEFLELKSAKAKSDSAQLVINRTPIKLPATPLLLSSEQQLSAIDRETGGRTVSGYTQQGLGKSGFQLLTNTFSLQLSGQQELYAAIWAKLITAVARKERNAYQLEFESSFPHHSNEPIRFRVISGAEQPTVVYDSINVPLQKDPLIRNVWHGRIWAGSTRWNTLSIAQDSSAHHFYVSPDSDWQSMRIDHQQKKLLTLVSRNDAATTTVVSQPIPRIVFLILFLISAGFLWLAPKL